MNGFYASLIFFGILLILVSLISIFLDKRKVFNFIKGFDKKKQELTEIISDAEQMIEELNRFSDYIVNQMDLKNEELNKNLIEAEERVRIIKEKIVAAGIPEATVPISQTAVMETEVAYAVNSTEINAIHVNTSESVAAAYNKYEDHKPSAAIKKKEKVIPFNSRYSEVLKLAGEGLGSLEIAQRLHMGKGEVELIIGLRK